MGDDDGFAAARRIELARVRADYDRWKGARRARLGDDRLKAITTALDAAFASPYPELAARSWSFFAHVLAQRDDVAHGPLLEAADACAWDAYRAFAGDAIAPPLVCVDLIDAPLTYPRSQVRAATRALQNADFVVSLTPYKTGLEYADVLLPITAFTETAGTFVSMEGRVQSFQATVNPLGDARPGWKVLRVLGTMLGRPGCEIDTVEEARNACLNGRDVAKLLSNVVSLESKNTSEKMQGLQRIADVPIYFADPLVRRSPPLQRTKDAWAPKARMNAKLMTRLGLSKEDSVLIRQDGGQARLKAALDDRVPDECVRVAAAHPSTASLGAMFGSVEVEKAG